jgi:hypothetical protein
MRRGVAAFAVCAVAGGAAIAGCGGGDANDTKAQVNKICKDLDAKTTALNNVKDQQGFVTEGKKVIPELQKTLDKLNNVKANDEVRKKSGADYTKFVQNFADTGAAFQAMLAAAEAGDDAAFQQAQTQETKLSADGDALAKKLDFQDCISKN